MLTETEDLGDPTVGVEVSEDGGSEDPSLLDRTTLVLPLVGTGNSDTTLTVERLLEI